MNFSCGVLQGPLSRRVPVDVSDSVPVWNQRFPEIHTVSETVSSVRRAAGVRATLDVFSPQGSRKALSVEGSARVEWPSAAEKIPGQVPERKKQKRRAGLGPRGTQPAADAVSAGSEDSSVLAPGVGNAAENCGNVMRD